MDWDLQQETKPRREDLQHLMDSKEGLLPGELKWSPSPDQEGAPEPPHIKQEQEEVWSSQEGEQLDGHHNIEYPFAHISVKSEDDEEKPLSSQIHQRQIDQMETGVDAEDYAQVARNSHPNGYLHPETEDSCETEERDYYSQESREPQLGLKSLEASEIDNICSIGEKPFSCSECGKQFNLIGDLNRHMKIHTGEKPFSCSVCCKRFRRKGHLAGHMTVHTGERRFSCSVCGKGFIYTAHLTVHMKIHTGEKPFSCSLCGSKFSRNTQLKIHMRIHTGEKPFSCSVCGKEFARKEHLTEHKVVHTGEKPYGCSVCDKRFTRFASVRNHKCGGPLSSKLHGSQSEENTEAESRASSLTDDFIIQVKEEQEELWTNQEGEQLQGLEDTEIMEFPFNPVLVKSEDDEETTQLSHLQQIKTEQITRGAAGEDCGGANLARNSHPDTHSLPETEDHPEESSQTENSDGYSVETGIPLLGLKSLKNDKASKSDTSCDSRTKPYMCSICGKGYCSPSDLKRHIRTHTGEKPYRCSVCGKGFGFKSGLKVHTRTHTEEKPFNCSNCSKTFRCKSHLQEHMKTHTGEKPFNCSVCDKSYTQKESLRRHIAVHTGVKSYSCHVCEQSFTWDSQLRKHKCVGRRSSQHHLNQSEENREMDVQTNCLTERMTRGADRLAEGCEDYCKLTTEPQLGVNPIKNDQISENEMMYNTEDKPFRCTKCGKEFVSKWTLKIHMRIHTGEKVCICPVCDKTHTKGQSLKQHMSVHTGEQIFNCSICDQRFTRGNQPPKHKCVSPVSFQLQRHTARMETGSDGEDCGGAEPARNSHTLSNPETEDQTKDSSETEDSDDYSQAPGRPQLGLKSLKNAETSDGNEKPNPGDKPYSCSECWKRFSSNGTLKRHMRVHTGEKPFSCSICGKAFTQRVHLTHHMVVHTREKCFNCSICEQRFTWYTTFRNHKCASHRSSKLNQNQTKNGASESQASSSNEKLNLQVKEEPVELWSSQVGEQLQGLEETEIIEFPFTPVHVRSEDDDEKPLSS